MLIYIRKFIIYNIISEEEIMKLDINKNQAIDKQICDVIKYFFICIAFLIGVVMSFIMAYKHIDFDKILQIISKNILSFEILNELACVMSESIKNIGIRCLVIMVIILIYSICNKKRDGEYLKWSDVFFLCILLILISQYVFPYLLFVVAVVISLIYFLLCSSVVIKTIIAYPTYLFICAVEIICSSSGITLTYEEFIGQENYSIYLTMITFFISIPYLIPVFIKVIKRIIQLFVGKKIGMLFFKPIEKLISVNTLRYVIYMLLFFISIYTYSLNISKLEYILPIIKESLLEFVLLDTVIFSIVSNTANKVNMCKRKKAKMKYLSYKYDLEFVMTSIIMHNMNDLEISAKIIFSEDINRIKKRRVEEGMRDIDSLLIDISTNYYRIDTLEKKVRKVLSMIIESID